MYTTIEFDVACPVCKADMRILGEATPPDPEVGHYFPAYAAEVVEQECQCQVTEKKLSDMARVEFESLLDQY